jgi:dTDP-4-dehydrorhamnose 3,5-epimerase
MRFNKTSINGVYLIDLDLFEDERGWFARTFCKNEFEKIGHQKEWVQINHSFTKNKGTVRGMHYQNPPNSEIKLVRCIAGKIFDVAVDLRKNSASFLKWFGTELSSANKKMLYIPQGCAHGFLSLSDEVEIIYHHTDFYTQSAEGGIHYSDPSLNIDWPIDVKHISERDKNFPELSVNFKGLEI